MSREREYVVGVEVTICDRYIVSARNATEARQRYWDMDTSEAQDRCLSTGEVSKERIYSVRRHDGIPYSAPVAEPLVADPPAAMCEHGQLAPHALESGMELGDLPSVDCPGPATDPQED